jgi:hypothetical protein
MLKVDVVGSSETLRLTKLRGITSHKKEIAIMTAVRTSNLTTLLPKFVNNLV